MERDIRALRRTPETYANIGFKQIVDHYEKLVIELESAPILIGHCFGGLVVQALLDRGLGACGVAIASAPIKGIWTLPYSTMRVVTPQLLNPRNNHRCRAADARAVPLRVHEHRLARGIVPHLSALRRAGRRITCCSRPSSRTSIRSRKPRSTCGATTARRC